MFLILNSKKCTEVIIDIDKYDEKNLQKIVDKQDMFNRREILRTNQSPSISSFNNLWHFDALL